MSDIELFLTQEAIQWFWSLTEIFRNPARLELLESKRGTASVGPIMVLRESVLVRSDGLQLEEVTLVF